MKKNNLSNSILMLFAFLLVTSTSFAQIKTEEDMAKAVFETIRTSDLETFSSYCATEDRMANMIEGMGESTPKEKAIKQDIKGEKAADLRNECIDKFELFLEELTSNNIVIQDGVFPKTITEEVRFEITNLKTSEVTFNASFDNIEYEIEINVFNTATDIFIYDIYFVKSMNSKKVN